MYKSQFRVADLQFLFETESFKKLAHAKDLIRQAQNAVKDLREASGVDNIEVIREEPEGHEYFRLKAYSYPHKYTIDISLTKPDNPNPLGFYVAYDKPIVKYNYETEKREEISRGNKRVSHSKQNGEMESSQSQKQERQQGAPRQQKNENRANQGEESVQSSGGQGRDNGGSQTAAEENSSEMKYDVGANDRKHGRTIQNEVVMKHNEQKIGNVELKSGAVALTKLEKYIDYLGKESVYLQRVAEALGVDSPKNITVQHFPDVMKLVWSSALLQEQERQLEKEGE